MRIKDPSHGAHQGVFLLTQLFAHILEAAAAVFAGKAAAKFQSGVVELVVGFLGAAGVVRV